MPADAAASRLFASPAQCQTAGKLDAGTCRTAFANALAEFDAKAPSFRSRRACLRAFGPCMPWPVGTHRLDDFRPQWIGISLDEGAVLPAVAPGHRAIAFQPQSIASLSAAATAVAPKPEAPSAPQPEVLTPDERDGGEQPAGHAGGGFTMIDGVLTYPAPARFQPRNLRKP